MPEAVSRLLPALPDARSSNSVTRPRDNFECLSRKEPRLLLDAHGSVAPALFSKALRREEKSLECLSVYYTRAPSRHRFLMNFRHFCNDLSPQDLGFAEGENVGSKRPFSVLKQPRSVDPSGAEAPGAAVGSAQLRHLSHHHPGNRRYHELGNAVATTNGKGLTSQVGQHHHHFTPIVAIDGSWGIEETDAVTDGEATARPHLTLPPSRQLEDESCRDQGPLPRIEQQVFSNSCSKIEARAARRGLLWQR